MLAIRHTKEMHESGNEIVLVRRGNSDSWENAKKGYFNEEGIFVEIINVPSLDTLTYSYEKDGKVYRKETKKALKELEGNRVIGCHEYTTSKDDKTIKRAIIQWRVYKETWVPSVKKGLTDLSSDEINAMLDCMSEIGWISVD